MSNNLKVTLSLVDDFTRKLSGIEANLGAFGQKIDTVSRIAAHFGLGFGVGFAGIQIKDQIEGLINEAKEYTKIQNQLRESLGYTSTALLDQSDALEKKYLIDDRDIQRVQQRISLYTQDEKSIQQLTDATLNYAAATGKDLAAAAEMIDRAIASQKGSIRGLGISLDGAAGSSERLASIAEGLNRKFHGQAEAVANSKTWWDRLKVSIDNARESIAIGMFGKDVDREALQYKEAKGFVEGYADKSNFYRKQYESEYRYRVKFVEEYEKKVADAKLNARKALAESNAGNIPSLTPGFKDTQEYQKAMKQQADDAKKAAEELGRNQIAQMEYGDKKLDELDNEHHRLKEETDKIGLEKQKEYLDAALKEINEHQRLKEETDKIGLEKQKEYLDAALKEINDNNQEANRLDKEREEEAKRHKERMQKIAYSISTSFGEIIGQNIGKGQEGLKNALKGMLNVALSFAQRELSLAVFTNAAKKFGYLGVPGLFIAGAEAAGVTALFEGVKSAVSSFSVGTPYAPAGPAFVHKDESIYLPAGTQVKTASETRQIANGAAPGHTFQFNIQDSSGKIVESMRMQLRADNTDAVRLANQIVKLAGLNL